MMRICKPVLIPEILIFSWLVPVFQVSAITIDAKLVIEPLPGIKLIQLTAGVYYDPQLAAYEQIRIRSILADKVLIGKNSVQLFDTVSHYSFRGNWEDH